MHTSDSASGSSSNKPTAPRSGSVVGGSSPSKPKSPVSAPPKKPSLPKIPTLPKIPKPGSGTKPPKGSLPGLPPGHPPYRGSGGHMPGGIHGQGHHSHHASSTTHCIHPKGLDRLRCARTDAIVGTTFAILAFLTFIGIALFICLSIRRKKAARKARHDEEAMEMTRVAMDGDPGLQKKDVVPDVASNIGRAVSTPDENNTLAREPTQDTAGRDSSLALWPPLSNYSSGMIRTANLGLALQESNPVNVPPSLAGSTRNSESRRSANDSGESFHCESCENEERHGPRGGLCDPVRDINVGGGMTESSRRLSSHSPSETTSRRSHTRANSPPVCHEGEIFFPSGLEPVVDSEDPHHL